MTVSEIVYENEWRRPKDKETDYAGKLTRSDLDELTEWMNPNGTAAA